MRDKVGLRFPKGFLWGAASSAHQYEGGNHNQWSVWELENAKSLATSAPYHYDDLENWPDIKKIAKTPANYVSGKGIYHRDLYEKDFDLMVNMGMNAWRFSIEWSRIQPAEDAWSAEAIGYYRNYLTALKKRGIEPVVTLFHFTLPVWFADKGGFARKSNIRYFTSYVSRLFDELGMQFKYVITINEPEIYATNSYKQGIWPPNVIDKKIARTVSNNLALAHNSVAKLIHSKNKKHKVSVAKNSAFYYPGDDAKLTVRSALAMQYISDDIFLKKVIKNCDFLGVNYYFSNRVYGYRVHNPEDTVSDVGWSMEPQNLEFVVERLYDKYNKPIMITENGVADDEDKVRGWWLRQSVMAMNRSIGRGVPIIGYLHWSLLDNFEWEKGYWPKFGLFEVDRSTGARKPRQSARFYKQIIKVARKLK